MSPVKDPKVELVIVMFVVPLVVNVSIVEYEGHPISSET